MDSSALANSIAALRSSISSLESRSNSLDFWLYFWVSAVVIGVVLEVGFVAWEYGEEREEYHRGTIRSPQMPSGWKLFFELAGALLVAIGVTGELAVDIKSGGLQTALRTKNGELIQLLEGVSSTALSNAAVANEHAGDIGKLLDTEHAIVGRLQTREQEAEARLGKATVDLNEAQGRMDLDIRKRYPRGLLLHDASIWLDPRIRRFKGQRALLLVCMPVPVENPEIYRDPSRAFLTAQGLMTGLTSNPVVLEISETLRELGRQLLIAKWQITPAAVPCAGVGIRIHVDPTADFRTKDAAELFARVLHDALLLPTSEPPVTISPDVQYFVPPLATYSVQQDSRHSFAVLINNNPILMSP